MQPTNLSTNSSIHLPSRGGLLVRVVVAAVVAAVVVLLFVLPAEFRMDPTGFGKLTGLTGMSGAQSSPSSAPPVNAVHSYPGPFRTDEVDLGLAPGEEYEYKVKMKPGGTLVYSWTSSKPLEFDFHGEPDDKPGQATDYTPGNAAAAHGSLIAPFQGIHGWYWKNATKDFVDIKVKMAGQYELTVDFNQ
jgi:hypothetical protein